MFFVYKSPSFLAFWYSGPKRLKHSLRPDLPANSLIVILLLLFLNNLEKHLDSSFYSLYVDFNLIDSQIFGPTHSFSPRINLIFI